MQFAAWFALCLVAALLLRRHLFVLLMAALVLWCLVPGVAAHRVIGAHVGLLDIHPAAVLVIVVAGIQAVARPLPIARALSHRPEWTLLLTMVALLTLVVGILGGAIGRKAAIAASIDQMFAPVTFFFLVGAALLERPDRVEALRRIILGLAVVESVLAMAQALAQSPLVFSSDYANQTFLLQGLNRWMGTFDHPLILSLFLTVALFLVAGVRSGRALVPLVVIFLVGTAVTQSRTGLVAAGVAVVYVLAVGRASARVRAVLSVLVAAAVIVVLEASLGQAILGRIANDTGSTGARVDALHYFITHLHDYLWIGEGLNASFSVSQGAGLGTSFESSFLMYAIDLGAVVALLYFGVMLWTVQRSFRHALMPGVTGAALAALVIPQTFSALSGNTAAPALVWLVFGLAGFGPVRSKVVRIWGRAAVPRVAGAEGHPPRELAGL